MYHQPIKQMRAALAEREPAKKPDYTGIGQMLREARESLGLTVENAAHELRIKAAYIRSLESGLLQDIPSMTYAKGYLRMYASFLGVNLDTMLSLVETGIKVRQISVPVIPSKQEGRRMQWAMIVSLGVLFLGGIVWFFSGGNPSPRKTPARVAAPVELQNSTEISACLKMQSQPAYPPCYETRPSGAVTVMDSAVTHPVPGKLP